MNLTGFICMPEDTTATEQSKPKLRVKGNKKQKLKQLKKEKKLAEARERKAAKEDAKRQKTEEREDAKALKKEKEPEPAEEPEKEPEAKEPKKKKKKKEAAPKKAPKAKKQKKAKGSKSKKKKKGKKDGKEGKKGKMPVMIVLGVVLLGGGFFGLKMMGGGGEPEIPPIVLGDPTHVLNLGEFLVNTSDGKTFLRATIGVHLADGTALFHSEGGGHDDSGPGFEMTAPYTDAVRSVLRRQTLNQLMSEEGERAIKIKIAAAINDVYARYNHEDGHEEEEPADGEHHEEEEPEIVDESWHSQTGPVLVVYLTDYVWE